MLRKILENLKTYPEDECYVVSGKIFKNKELYKYVCNIYKYLLENNKGKKSVVVYGHKEIYMIASFLACSCAGFGYVPIDETTPTERKKKILEQIQPEVIIDNNIEEIMDSEEYSEISEIQMRDEDVYYTIFTSGSTGEPKGVQITYNNLKSCMSWLELICKMENGVILNQANYSFDLSVADIYLPLLTRSKHYILERNVQKNYPQLFQEIQKSKADFAVFTPSFLDYLLVDKAFNSGNIPSLKKVLLCGEKLTNKTVCKTFERFPNLCLINSYGPTECTFAVTSLEINNNEENFTKDISIGLPKPDVEIYIVDENLEEKEEGQTGEILITGSSVGKGYLNNVSDGFINYKGKKGYLTGDLGYVKDNKYYCTGRKDTQVKYKGYRVELSEIEKVLNNIEEVEKAIVVAKKNEEGKVKRLIGFVKVKKEKQKEKQEDYEKIKNELKKKLPDYMIPNIKIIDEIPLTINGKVNTKKLLEEL